MQLTPKLILGTFGDDVLDGTKNRDLIVGLTGDDTAFGFNGDDILIGGEGNDHLLAGNGNDFLTGGSGRDRLNGGQGHDTLSGDDGDDGIVGGRGNDLLIGGGGDDKFRFNPHRSDEGHDTIKDFTLGEDKIFLKVGDVIASTPGLVDAIIANGGDAAGTFKALLGDRVSVDGNTIVDGEPDLSDAQIIAADIQTGNGVVQVIDEVLLFDI
ncbi:MAG: M10 family metallopeptidase C-terminal domain-containing protein [Pseudomonadota bacterium]